MVLMEDFLNNVKRLINQYVYTKEETRQNFDDFIENEVRYINGNFVVNDKVKSLVSIIPPLDGTDEITSWTSGTNNTADGIFTSHGSVLTQGWNNTDSWTVEYEYRYTSTTYIGVLFLCDDTKITADSLMAGHALGTWEGGFPPNWGGGNTIISSPDSFSKPSQTQWNHIKITKLSSNTIELILNDTYTWVYQLTQLPNWSELHFGSKNNPSSPNTGGNIQFRNIVIETEEMV